jgi:hypothetical protein
MFDNLYLDTHSCIILVAYLIWLSARMHVCLAARLPVCLLYVCLSGGQHAVLFTCLRGLLVVCLPVCLPTYLSAWLPACLSSSLPAFLRGCLPAFTFSYYSYYPCLKCTVLCFISAFPGGKKKILPCQDFISDPSVKKTSAWVGGGGVMKARVRLCRVKKTTH